MVSRISWSVMTGMVWICLSTLTSADDFLSPGIAPADLLKRLGTERAPLVVDLRAPVEYGVAHIPGAVNIPLVYIHVRCTCMLVKTGFERVFLFYQDSADLLRA
jgi:hypothetical protein